MISYCFRALGWRLVGVRLLRRGMALALSLLMSASVTAQDVDPGAKARSQMDRLKVLEGEYRLVVHVTNDDGATWQQGPAQKVEIRLRHNGLLLEELPVELAEQGFHMNTYLTFDQYRSVFRKAAIDDVWGVMDIYQGKIADGTLVLTNLESGTLFPVGPDTWRGFRLSLPLVSGERTMLIEKTDDLGKSWQPAFKSVYTPNTP
ncbi:MAG: hypothetical protein V2I66_14545 [Halieaceae bacterium]|jgi:hypothetical protein|nr:hypothetical protein [Halieaceae bacterium]